MGLALRNANLTSAVVGHDIDRSVAGKAKKVGAVDRTDWNLLSACDGADLVILATPVDAIEPTLEAIGPELRPGCVVIDTATIKEPVMAWAAAMLPDGIHFVGGDPLPGPAAAGLSGVDAARADLLENALFCVVPSPSANEEAVKLAIDLVQIFGAKPLFLDAVEHDGLVAAVEHLPMILALALTETLVHQPAWRELRKVAGASSGNRDETGCHRPDRPRGGQRRQPRQPDALDRYLYCLPVFNPNRLGNRGSGGNDQAFPDRFHRAGQVASRLDRGAMV